jgi:hypothetical protein
VCVCVLWPPVKTKMKDENKAQFTSSVRGWT